MHIHIVYVAANAAHAPKWRDERVFFNMLLIPTNILINKIKHLEKNSVGSYQEARINFKLLTYNA